MGSKPPLLDIKIWGHVPQDLKTYVIARLQVHDFAHLHCICKEWYAIVSMDTFLDTNPALLVYKLQASLCWTLGRRDGCASLAHIIPPLKKWQEWALVSIIKYGCWTFQQKCGRHCHLCCEIVSKVGIPSWSTTPQRLTRLWLSTLVCIK